MIIRKYHPIGWWLAAFAIVLGAYFGGNAIFTVWQINQSQHKWCDTLSLFTHKEPPSPQGKQFYMRVKGLEQSFGCKH